MEENTSVMTVTTDLRASQPMPKAVREKLWVMRNDQLIPLLDLTNQMGIEKVIADCKKNNIYLEQNYTDKKILTIRSTYHSARKNEKVIEITSWGDLVEFAIERQFDLTGLTLSPEQKLYAYKNELKGRDLSKGKLDQAQLPDMDISSTNFSEASLNQANLRNTTGKAPVFQKAKAQQADFSGAKYITPNFVEMKAARSVHFKSQYEEPTFKSTDWNSSRLVAAHFYFKPDKMLFLGVDLSSAFAAGCLFYGMGSEKVAFQVSSKPGAFPGSCFYNMNVYCGNSYVQKADFSPLSMQDPRLLADELEYLSSFGQWLNGVDAADGVKVSPEIDLPQLDKERLYTMFSETDFHETTHSAGVQVFSKREVLWRKSFHECEMADFNNLLPESLRQAPPPSVQTESVLTEKVIDKPVFLQVPEFDNFDRAKQQEQIAGLKDASIADASAIGIDLQAIFGKAATFVSQWALAGIGQKTEFSHQLAELIQNLEFYQLVQEPELVMPRPPVAVRRAGFMGWIVDAVAGVQEVQVALPEPKDEAFIRIRKDVAGLPELVTKAITEHAESLTNIESLKKYLDTLQEAMTGYVDGLKQAIPELQDTKEVTFVKAINIRQQSLEATQTLLSALTKNIATVMDAEMVGGESVQWAQGINMPKLNTHFARASALYDLAAALIKNNDSYKSDQILSGLYNISVSGSDSSPINQVGAAFDKSRTGIIDLLEEVQSTLKRAEEGKINALKAILG